MSTHARTPAERLAPLMTVCQLTALRWLRDNENTLALALPPESSKNGGTPTGLRLRGPNGRFTISATNWKFLRRAKLVRMERLPSPRLFAPTIRGQRVLAIVSKAGGTNAA